MASTEPLPATRYPGVGPRSVATVIDGIVGFVVIGLPVLLIFGKTSRTNGPSGTTTSHTTNDPKVLALWALLAVAYYVAFEVALGATPGKLVLGLRVRSATGGKLTLKAAVVRNVLRVADAFPYAIPYLVGAIAVWSDGSVGLDPVPNERRLRRRLGDRAAGTIVTYR